MRTALSIRKLIVNQFILRFILLYFIFFVIGLAGCDTGNNDSGYSFTQIDEITYPYIPVKPGDLLPNGTLQDKLMTISQRTDKNTLYDIAIDNNYSYSPLFISTQGENVTVRIHSVSTIIRTLSLSSQGSLFNVGANIILILENIIIQGTPNNNMPLISITEGGTLIILDGTSIRDNHNDNTNGYDGNGGGINVGTNGRLYMKGGEICYNFIRNGSGGGVYIQSGGFFNMIGGIIHNNEAEISSRGLGGGVCIYERHVLSYTTFIMNGGEIASNTAFSGGGVYVSGKFVKLPLPNQIKTGVIWGYPANGKENYANGASVSGGSSGEQNGTIGEYDYIY